MSGPIWMLLAFSLGGVLSAASGEIASPCSAAAVPSNFDYVVLASLADSQHPISMTSYRPAAREAPGTP
jgi:hypothetical protein